MILCVLHMVDVQLHAAFVRPPNIGTLSGHGQVFVEWLF